MGTHGILTPGTAECRVRDAQRRFGSAAGQPPLKSGGPVAQCALVAPASPRPKRLRQGDRTAGVITMMARHCHLRFMVQDSSAPSQNALGGIDRGVLLEPSDSGLADRGRLGSMPDGPSRPSREGDAECWRVCHSRPIFMSSGDFGSEMAISDSPAWSYSWNRPAETLHRQSNDYFDALAIRQPAPVWPRSESLTRLAAKATTGTAVSGFPRRPGERRAPTI